MRKIWSYWELHTLICVLHKFTCVILNIPGEKHKNIQNSCHRDISKVNMGEFCLLTKFSLLFYFSGRMRIIRSHLPALGPSRSFPYGWCWFIYEKNMVIRKTKTKLFQTESFARTGNNIALFNAFLCYTTDYDTREFIITRGGSRGIIMYSQVS